MRAWKQIGSILTELCSLHRARSYWVWNYTYLCNEYCIILHC